MLRYCIIIDYHIVWLIYGMIMSFNTIIALTKSKNWYRKKSSDERINQMFLYFTYR